VPFEYLKPYSTIAGGIPLEVFCGRRRKIESIVNLHQSHLIFGGRCTIYYSDMSLLENTARTQIFPTTVPRDRYAFGMDFDSAASAIVIFGGYSSGPAMGDTWELAPAP